MNDQNGPGPCMYEYDIEDNGDKDFFELRCAVQTICRNYKVDPNDLLMVYYRSILEGVKEQRESGIYLVKKFPNEILNKEDGKYFNLFQISFGQNNPYYTGIGEYYCVPDDGFEGPYYKHPNKIRFWEWMGRRTNYPVVTPTLLMLKKDWPLFYRAIKKRRSKQKAIDPPILPGDTLQVLYRICLLSSMVK